MYSYFLLIKNNYGYLIYWETRYLTNVLGENFLSVFHVDMREKISIVLTNILLNVIKKYNTLNNPFKCVFEQNFKYLWPMQIF